jgi:hypothetical protein
VWKYSPSVRRASFFGGAVLDALLVEGQDVAQHPATQGGSRSFESAAGELFAQGDGFGAPEQGENPVKSS